MTAPRVKLSEVEATGDDLKAGWRLDFKWLVQMRTEIERATGYGATLEVIEETIVRTRAPLSAFTDKAIAAEYYRRFMKPSAALLTGQVEDGK